MAPKSKRKVSTPAPSDDEPTWPGNATVLELLREAVAVANRTEAGVNMLNTRVGDMEKDITLLKQNVTGVMELGGSVLDAKEEMSKGLRKVQSQLHALTKAQTRTYDLIQKHAQQPHAAAHPPAKAKH